MIAIKICEQTIQLLPQRAAYWEENKALIVADIHLGKAATMQRAGIAVPEGAMDQDLINLKNIIEHTGAQRCIVVGDLIHAQNGLSEGVQSKFGEWLSTINCSVDLILGNHDQALKNYMPASWKLQVHQEYLAIKPFYFNHFPVTIENHFVWSGHLHPQILLKSRHDQLNLRCFQISDSLGVLPAFSDFVGGSPVTKNADNRIFALAGKKVVEI
ncbi:hypothetical protein NEOC84_000834|uniref:ligase-associated DNA damage response endonuclease PdeM n=1 Tax=Neochlamydia sp. AcF84 TaxID=2315858 RepID=UPI0014092373|nr:ligase-associated DNA damage response endonuclease PdeM [Neochlamydia sp. AcF84]NGY94931.1 hypothetical protein [Neochlamydia sp. AcF84]